MDLDLRRAVAEELLGEKLDDRGYARCPGATLHNKRSGKRDFRVVLEGAPTGHCFHASCSAEVDEFNKELRSRIGKLESRDDVRGRHWRDEYGRIAPPPRREDGPKRPKVDRGMLQIFVAGARVRLNRREVMRRSPLAVDGLTSGDFLEALYQPGEKVLVFLKQFSQGDFLWWVGKGGFRLGREPGVRAVRSELPKGGPEGVWYLTNPVCGEWKPNPARDGEKGRRHGTCVTSWRYMVLESDEVEEEEWLTALGRLPLPLAALYTSGSRSIHALVRLDAPSKPAWDALRDEIRPMMCLIGADPGAMSAVRLSRLPGTLRGDRPQELLFLDPTAAMVALEDRRRLR